MFVSGTASTGAQGYCAAAGSVRATSGIPVCHVTFPDLTTADIQVSAEYLVYGLRREYKLAGRKVAIYGISQGGLISRFALTYWPDLRRKVGDLFSAAGTQHGTDIDFGGCAGGCAPAIWQQLERLEAAPGPQLPAGRDARRRLLHDRPHRAWTSSSSRRPASTRPPRSRAPATS